MRGQTVQSPVLAAALAEAQRRKVAVIAENIRKEVIFPLCIALASRIPT